MSSSSRRAHSIRVGKSECRRRRSPGCLASRRTRSAASAIFNEDGYNSHFLASDPIRFELNRLADELRDKDRQIEGALAEIRSLKISERAKEKAFDELREELTKLEAKLKGTESLLESKNLEVKRSQNDKKAAAVARSAAEATLRRLRSTKKDDDSNPVESIVTSLEAELKLKKLEVAKLQDDNKALERLTKSKESALIEAEKTVEDALAKASLVDDVQNKNQELLKQIEICQEENKILDKMHRLKVAEVTKLTLSVRQLEEALLAGGAAANVVREYKRKVQELHEEKRTLEREVARAKVCVNRVANVVANEWKDNNDKVMPVKQWLEERRILQGEMQKLKEKLAVVERAAKAEAQLKDKYLLRFKVLDEKLNRRVVSEKARGGGVSSCTEAPTGVDDSGDYVSGALYDVVQKELIALQKACNEKNQSLKNKDERIETLAKKVETLNRAKEAEAKRMRREVAAIGREMENLQTTSDHNHRVIRLSNASRR